MSNMYEAALLLAAGFMPGIEPRYITPLLAKLLGLGQAAVISSLEVVALSLILTLLIVKLTEVMDCLSGRLGFIGKIYSAARRRAERKRELIDKYGAIGLAAFVAIPLPFTGIYTGALLAFLVGLDKWRTFLALTVGGLVSVALLLAASTGVLAVKLG
jgi:uncharacterized membrane protein